MQDEKTYPYDVFISYRWVTPDQEWVREHLRPALKQAGLKVLLDVEDHVPGRDIILETQRSVLESRHVLCVISPEYEKGQLVRLESLLARRLDPTGQRSFLIPLIVRETELSAWISGLIRITLTDPKYDARQWRRLLEVLRAPDLTVPPPVSIQAGPQNPSDVFSSEGVSDPTGLRFRPTTVRREAVPQPWHNKKLRNAIYVTAVLLITTFSVLVMWQGFTGGSDPIGVNPEATPHASPQPTTAPTASPTATPTPSRPTPPSIEPAHPQKVPVPPPTPQPMETKCSPKDRTLGNC